MCPPSVYWQNFVPQNRHSMMSALVFLADALLFAQESPDFRGILHRSLHFSPQPLNSMTPSPTHHSTIQLKCLWGQWQTVSLNCEMAGELQVWTKYKASTQYAAGIGDPWEHKRSCTKGLGYLQVSPAYFWAVIFMIHN